MVSSQSNDTYPHVAHKDLSYACYSGNLETIIDIYNSNPSIDLTFRDNKLGRTYMWIACAYNHIEICQFLYQQGGCQEDIWTMDDRSRSPLWIASAYGHLSVCEWLLEEQLNDTDNEDSDIRTEDDQDRSPFWIACSNGIFKLSKTNIKN